MRKFRVSMEPFLDLKICKCVGYLMHVSSEYFISRMQLKFKYGWLNFLAHIIPIASVCYV